MLQEVYDNKYVSTAITVALGLYAALLGPEVPDFVKDLFNNTIFRIFILFIVVVRGNKDPKMAIMIAIAFVLTLDYIYAKSAKETFKAVESMCDSFPCENRITEPMCDSFPCENRITESMCDSFPCENRITESMCDSFPCENR
jgi:hypothetical protein